MLKERLGVKLSREKVRQFVQEKVSPSVEEIEKNQTIDDQLFRALKEEGYLGSQISYKYGGMDLNNEELGILHEEFGKGHASIENILTVIGMASIAIARGGNQQLREKWLPKIASGEVLPAIALTEPHGGSHLRDIRTRFISTDAGFLIEGRKRWITLGTHADIFVILAREGMKSACFLIEKKTPGLSIQPIRDMMGFRGNLLAELKIESCMVPHSHLLGSIGMGDTIASFGLQEGRYTTAWGAVGLAEAALDRLLCHFIQKTQFNQPISHLENVQQVFAKMKITIEAAKQLCIRAGELRENHDAEAIEMVLMAKYQASKAAVYVSQHCLQLMGASGCHQNNGMERHYRDAKLFELIEGSSEILEIEIGRLALGRSDGTM